MALAVPQYSCIHFSHSLISLILADMCQWVRCTVPCLTHTCENQSADFDAHLMQVIQARTGSTMGSTYVIGRLLPCIDMLQVMSA